MTKYQIVFMDGSVKTLPVTQYFFSEGFIFFLNGTESLDAFATSTVKSFSQLPPGAA